MKKISKIFKFQKISLHRFFFHMFDLQLGQLPPLCTAYPLKQSFPTFYEYMNGISQIGEAW
jgi:hypothetical protein